MSQADLLDINKLRQDIIFTEEVEGIPFSFKTTWGLFSPKAVDEGSKMLLKYVEVNEDDDSLDVGCGYGVLGMVLAKKAPKGHALLIDKDFVAVDYSQQNITRNHLTNASTQLSNGFKQLEGKTFDLIVSNLPAKVGNEMLTLYVQDAFDHLNPGGRFYVVKINSLRHFIKRSFNTIFGNFNKLKQGKTYTVSMAIKPD